LVAGYRGRWKMEDNEIGNKKLLVARSNKECRKIYKEIQYILENEKQDRDTSREVDGK